MVDKSSLKSGNRVGGIGGGFARPQSVVVRTLSVVNELPKEGVTAANAVVLLFPLLSPSASSSSEAAPIKCDGRESAGLPTLSLKESVGLPALST